MPEDENEPEDQEEQVDEQMQEAAEVEEPQLKKYDLIERLESIPNATGEDAEIFSRIYEHIHQILRTGEFEHGNIDQDIEHGTDEWDDKKNLFERCFEQVCTEQMMRFLFQSWGSLREDIETESCLGSDEHGVDGYILVKERNLPDFGLTIIQSKFRSLKDGSLRSEKIETANTAVSLLSKILEKQNVGNAQFRTMVEEYHKLNTDGTSSEPVPIRHLIFTPKPMEDQPENFREVCNRRNISVISYSQLFSLIQKIVAPAPVNPVGDITLEGKFVKRENEAERVVHVGYVTGKSLYEAVHAGDGKREDSLLEENVRMNLKYAEKKRRERANNIRTKFEKTLEEEPKSILSYNNGIVICHIGDMESNQDKHTMLEPRLVNGGQTASVILDHGWGDDDGATADDRLANVCVPAKLVQVQTHKESRLIAEAANDQNPVTKSDMAATSARLRTLANWLKTELDGNFKIYLSLKAGEVETLTESGGLDPNEFTWSKVPRIIEKEEWSTAALYAAGTGYSLSVSKEPLWESHCIDVCYVPSTDIECLGSLRKTQFNTNSFFNEDERTLVETILLANLVRKIFVRIGKIWTTRRGKMDEGQKVTADAQTQVLKSFAGIGTGLFFEALRTEHQGDYGVYTNLVKFLIGGKGMLDPRGEGTEATKPSWGLVNSFAGDSRVRKWLKENEVAGHHIPIDYTMPATETAENQHIHNLVRWCVSIAQVGWEVYGGYFSGDVKGAVQSETSEDFIRRCNSSITNRLTDSNKFPKPTPVTPPAPVTAVVEDGAAEEDNIEEVDPVSHDIEYFFSPDFGSKDTLAKRYWLKKRLEMEIFQTEDAAEEREILQEALDNLNADT